MNTNGHKDFQSARRELSANGYAEAFSSPGRPFLFVKKGGSRMGVHEKDGEWRIVTYPEPAVVSPGDLKKEKGYDATQV